MKICDSAAFETLRKYKMTFFGPSQNNIFKLHNQLETKLSTHFRDDLSPLKNHKFQHNFQNSVNFLGSCGNGIESTVHFLQLSLKITQPSRNCQVS